MCIERLVVAFAGGAAQRKYAPTSDWHGDTDWEAANTWLQYLLVGPPEEREDSYDDATGDYWGDVRKLPLRLLIDRKTPITPNSPAAQPHWSTNFFPRSKLLQLPC
jgi:hypothetical protein